MKRREKTPGNEFTENRSLILSCFFDLFALGIGSSPKEGTMPSNYIRHMYKQRDGRFGECPNFLFTVFNQVVRHANARGVSLTLKNNPELVAELDALLQSEGFSERLEYSKNHVESREAKEMLKKLMRYVNISSSQCKQPYGVTQEKKVISTICAFNRFFGSPSVFLTISPADIDGRLNLRVAWGCAKTKKVFVERVIPVELQFQQRVDLINGNPAIAAHFFELAIETILREVVGVEPNEKKCRRTLNPERFKNVKRAFGKIRAHLSILDSQVCDVYMLINRTIFVYILFIFEIGSWKFAFACTSLWIVVIAIS